MKKGKNILFIMLACLMLSGCGGKSDSSTNSIIVENVQNEAVSKESAQKSSEITTSNDENDSKKDIDQEETTGQNQNTEPHEENGNDKVVDLKQKSENSTEPQDEESDKTDRKEADDSLQHGTKTQQEDGTSSRQELQQGTDINQEIDLNKETDASAQSEEQSKQDELPVQEQTKLQPETQQEQETQKNQETQQEQEVQQEQASPQQQSDYGRIFFIGDSRTVDMFDKDATEIFDYKAGDIRVFARDGCVCTYMYDVMNQYGADEFDTIVSWLGCNDNKDVDSYKIIYEEILSKGKKLVICTVGPTADEYLSGDWDVTNYPNQYIISFNQKITEWAGSHGIKVIDLYSYVSNNIEISQDGIHYNPKPTTAIWNHILSELY
ncbi:SGNH/GDSL hydrolase family protein [Butyrivibrio sp. LC3010]|uniref:SGNH/GDSL hydrolase family protein n=1 Tax=Butyrivibrio sp. LC3010 TaxID=1280680 RepID=UPI000418EE4E|nr:SGNH/GDSL hydrolase family protein [Butyrivibrio sp. LC3010]